MAETGGDNGPSAVATNLQGPEAREVPLNPPPEEESVVAPDLSPPERTLPAFPGQYLPTSAPNIVPAVYSTVELFVACGSFPFGTHEKKQRRGRWIPAQVAVSPSEIKLSNSIPAVPSEVNDVELDKPGLLGPDLPGTFDNIVLHPNDVSLVYEMGKDAVPITLNTHPVSSTVSKPWRLLAFRTAKPTEGNQRIRDHRREATIDYVMLLRSENSDDLAALRSQLAMCPLLHIGRPVEERAAAPLNPPSHPIVQQLLKPVRRVVSLNKKRFESPDYSLDLAYITPQIVAMGFPTMPDDSEHLFRNALSDVQHFLETRHRGKYRVYNCCSERAYPASALNGQFVRYPFDDHQPPPIQQLRLLVTDMAEFVASDSENVVVVHCKAGKGRTGVAIVAYLLACRLLSVPEEEARKAPPVEIDLKEYGERRTKDGRGVTQNSQLRFLRYFDECLRDYRAEDPPLRPAVLASLIITTTPWISMHGGLSPVVVVSVRHPHHHHKPLGRSEWIRNRKLPVHTDRPVRHVTELDAIASQEDRGQMVSLYDSRDFEQTVLQRKPRHHLSEGSISVPLGSTTVADEFQISIYDDSAGSKKREFVCSFWLHTGFLDSTEGQATVTKDGMDGTSKGNARQYFNDKFAVTVHFSALEPEARRSESRWEAIRAGVARREALFYEIQQR